MLLFFINSDLIKGALYELWLLFYKNRAQTLIEIISAEISSDAPELFQLSMTGDKHNLVGTVVEGKELC